MIKNVKIIGLGLMGANLGINLVNKGLNVYGEDINPDVEKRAEKFGINIESNAEKYDLTILSMPINNIISFLSKEHEIDKSELIIDIGGTKESICDLMDNSNIPAIGGHPMCGLADNTNWEPHPEMYKNATFLLCETNSTDDKAREIASAFINILDCKEVWIDRKKHDEILSITSHLPHLISSALVGIAKKDYEIEEIMGLAAGGFDGATRLTRTNPEMIIDMYNSNSKNINNFLIALIEEISSLMSLQEKNELIDYLTSSVEWRRALSDKFGERPLS